MFTKGQCHCGAVQFEVTLSDGLNSARRCDCSLCRMRGAVAVSARVEDFAVVAGAAALRLYQFNTKVAQHYFCGACGIYTHHQRRSNPSEVGVNLACLQDQSPFLPEVKVLNGQAHPKDTGGADRVAGVLRFEAATGDARDTAP